jgi:hypothetical protein
MFIHALELRFAPSQYEDPKGSLFKLCQTGSVKEYQTAFESLANRIVGLPAPFYLSCFISGLKPEIRRKVQAFQPISLSHAISLAKLQEEKINDHPTASSNRRTPLTISTNTNSATTSKPPYKNPATLLQPNTPPQNHVPIKRLSPQELQARREKGLCYNCDDKFSPGHRCKRSFHILIAAPEISPSSQDQITHLLLENPPNSEPDPQHEIVPDPAQISLHALMGHSIPQTLRLTGHIKTTPVAILVDSGSTHNFIQDRIVKQLNLKPQPTQPFQVLVGNGEELTCDTMCMQTSLMLGQHNFLVDLFVLPLSGAEIVLGVQWLKTLGPVLTDYEHLVMKFIKDGSIVQLQGESKPAITHSSLHQLRRLVETQALDSIYQLHLLNSNSNSPPSSPLLPIQNLLAQYQDLFSEPTDLPPHRSTDHHII